MVEPAVRVTGAALPDGEIDLPPQLERKWSWRAAIGAWLLVAFVIAAGSAFAGLGWVNTVELANHGARVPPP